LSRADLNNNTHTNRYSPQALKINSSNTVIGFLIALCWNSLFYSESIKNINHYSASVDPRVSLIRIYADSVGSIKTVYRGELICAWNEKGGDGQCYLQASNGSVYACYEHIYILYFLSTALSHQDQFNNVILKAIREAAFLKRDTEPSDSVSEYWSGL
jgi:hypothetical protein